MDTRLVMLRLAPQVPSGDFPCLHVSIPLMDTSFLYSIGIILFFGENDLFSGYSYSYFLATVFLKIDSDSLVVGYAIPSNQSLSAG